MKKNPMSFLYRTCADLFLFNVCVSGNFPNLKIIQVSVVVDGFSNQYGFQNSRLISIYVMCVFWDIFPNWKIIQVSLVGGFVPKSGMVPGFT
jgi:hypothetical protein